MPNALQNNAASSQLYLENIIERLPYFIFWKNAAFMYLGCNQRFADLIGKESPKDIIGKTDFELGWGEGEAELFRQGDQAVMDGNAKINMEEILIRPDGEKIVMLVNKVPLRDKYGRCIGVLGTSTDITERKKMEEELNAAKEQAEVRSRVKTEFLANMSHDIKTPLSGIIGNAELLLQNTEDPKARHSLEEMMQCGQELLCFFDNCLELSKLENTDIIFIKERFSLKVLVGEVVSLFKPTASSKKLDLTVDYDEDIPAYVAGNRPALYRILQNLIGNAIKFTHAGYVKISVQLYKKISSEKVLLQLIVEDTGIGIPYDKHGVIFENLRRLTPSHQGIYQGSGIGLYIVDKFVKALSGEIYVESEENKGSKFTLALPLYIPLIASDTVPKKMSSLVSLHARQEAPAVSTRPSPSVKTYFVSILLVEDNKIAQKITRSLLTSLGCSVETADTGEQALSMLDQKQYDLVYMDIGLPGIDGCEVTRQWRTKESPSSTSLPIIALTAHARVSESSVCLEAGINGVLAKPLSLQQAAQIIECFVEGKMVEVEGLITFTP